VASTRKDRRAAFVDLSITAIVDSVTHVRWSLSSTCTAFVDITAAVVALAVANFGKQPTDGAATFVDPTVAVIVHSGVTHVANAVAVRVSLTRVRIVRAVVTHIANTVIARAARADNRGGSRGRRTVAMCFCFV
jgi:hypothetical protein